MKGDDGKIYLNQGFDRFQDSLRNDFLKDYLIEMNFLLKVYIRLPKQLLTKQEKVKKQVENFWNLNII